MARPRSLALGTLAAAVLGALALAAARHPSAHPLLTAADGLIVVETPDWAWSFDAVWRGESLHDLRADPGRRVNVLEAHPREAARLRGVLLRRMGIGSLGEVPREADAAVEVLVRLGYVGR